MATNEIYRYGDWLTVPVPDDAAVGDPVVWGGGAGIPGVIQVMYVPERPEIPGYEALPVATGFNESGEAIDPNLIPEGTVFGSVAFRGVWAFEIEGGDTVEIGAPVYFTDGELSLTAGGVLYGHVHNRGTDGRLHVRLAAVSVGA